MGGPSLPWRTYLDLFFNLFPRFVVPWISESESDSATGRTSQPSACSDTPRQVLVPIACRATVFFIAFAISANSNCSRDNDMLGRQVEPWL